jgi:hypothetical protein
MHAMTTFKTQGSIYELTAENIRRGSCVNVELLPTLTQIQCPIIPVLPVIPANSIVRKSTRYQAQEQTSEYEKYGDDDEPEVEPNPAVIKLSCNPVCVDISAKKRFPHSPTSSIMNQLFWCTFIACKGESIFDMTSNGFIKETEFKYETVEMIRGCKPLLKSAFKKYKLSLPNFEAELISSKRTTLQVAAGIALCHQKNILYIDGRLYIEICSRIAEDEDHDATINEYVVIEKQKNRYCVYKDIGNAELAHCRANLLKMESIDSPIRSISFYKVSDLEDMSRRIELHSLPPKIKKAELYDEIMKYIQSSGIIVS